MGKKNNFDEEDERKPHRKGKPKHSRNIPGQGMRVINRYVDEDYEDPFEDDIGIEDEIYITHTKDDTN